MGLSIYFRSTLPVHPAMGYEVSQRLKSLSAPYTWILCDAPETDHNRDGHLSGVLEPIFAEDPREVEVNDVDGCLMVAVRLLSEVSRELEVDWEFTHDYEPEVIGQIIEGEEEPELIEELGAVMNIGTLFGDFIDSEDEDWEPDAWGDEDLEEAQYANWKVETVDVQKPRLLALSLIHI